VSKIKRIALEEALYAIIHAADIMNYNEPMPLPSMRHLRNLESTLELPFSTFDGHYLYWHLYHRAAVLFYYVIKNHPLENGNKRSAVILAMLFLFINGKTLRATPDQIYNVAVKVAKSPAGDYERHIHALTETFKAYSVDLPKHP
jgi:death-on-curing family protein